MQQQTVRIHGHEIGYYAAGSGPLVVLVHGITGNSRTWREVIPQLARNYTVLAPDLLGHGASEKARGDYSLGAHASTMRDLLVALGHERATFVGHSLGGGVVLQFAYQFPDRVERLVLVDSGGLGEEVSPLLRLLAVPGAEYVMPIGCQPAVHRVLLGATAWMGKLGVRPSAPMQEIWDGYVSLGSRDGREAFLRTLRSVVDLTGQVVSAADRLYLAKRLPTMIVWGEADRIIPVSHAYDAHRMMPGSRLEVYPGVGHFPHRELTGRFTTDLEDFMAGPPARPLAEGEWSRLIKAGSKTPAGRSGYLPVRQRSTTLTVSGAGADDNRSPGAPKAGSPSRGARQRSRALTPALTPRAGNPGPR
ncbi:MAG: alpha/beta fold hydrolase [Candidatus Dormibacteria bacterium]